MEAEEQMSMVLEPVGESEVIPLILRAVGSTASTGTKGRTLWVLGDP